jgi:hypothetical protein
MKKNRLINKLLFALALPAMILGCDSDDDTGSSVDFGPIASSYYESSGTGTLTIPFRNASSDDINVLFGGTATEGEDYDLVGITREGVQLSIKDDSDLEVNETIRLQISGPGVSGNSIHTVTIVSNCEDLTGLTIADFAGEFNATEKYGPAPADWFGPYHVTIVQDETNPNKFLMDDFYGSGLDAYFIVDIAAGTVYFPDQTPDEELTASSGTFSFCTGPKDHLTLTMMLNYDGGDWEYEFVKE